MMYIVTLPMVVSMHNFILMVSAALQGYVSGDDVGDHDVEDDLEHDLGEEVIKEDELEEDGKEVSVITQGQIFYHNMIKCAHQSKTTMVTIWGNMSPNKADCVNSFQGPNQDIITSGRGHKNPICLCNISLQTMKYVVDTGVASQLTQDHTVYHKDKDMLLGVYCIVNVFW